METLRMGIIVALQTLRRPTRNKLGGRGVSRKRDPYAAVVVAEHITRMIARNHTFKKGEELCSAKDLERYLSDVLQKLPDPIVHQFASKSQMESHPAGEEITKRLLEAFESGWIVTYEQPVIVAHSAIF